MRNTCIWTISDTSQSIYIKILLELPNFYVTYRVTDRMRKAGRLSRTAGLWHVLVTFHRDLVTRARSRRAWRRSVIKGSIRVVMGGIWFILAKWQTARKKQGQSIMSQKTSADSQLNFNKNKITNTKHITGWSINTYLKRQSLGCVNAATSGWQISCTLF